MKRLPAILCYLLLASGAYAQVLQPALKRELDSIYVVDKRYRELIGETNTPHGLDSVAALVRKPVAETVDTYSSKCTTWTTLTPSASRRLLPSRRPWQVAGRCPGQ